MIFITGAPGSNGSRVVAADFYVPLWFPIR
jgi:hypothetical protein